MTDRTASGRVAKVVEHLFRHEAGRLIAILVRRFGPARLELAEDAVQEALLRAMRGWPLTGVPDNPTAWLLQTARNQLVDHARRQTRWRDKEPELTPLMEECLDAAMHQPAPRFEDEVRESQLRMMFVCCHPELAPETQVALILKTLCGFGEREIATALLAREAAVTKRLVRARQFLRERAITIDLPLPAELAVRLNGVLHALYLLFNEGYKASHGNTLLRGDLCAEAIRLAELLVTQPMGCRPETHALLALMYFHRARFAERLNEAGELQILAVQNRARWDRDCLATAAQHLAASAAGAAVTRFHLEAGIAAAHTLARDEAATDWRRIRALYDQLLARDDSPIVALNRAVAVARCDGARAGLTALAGLAGQPVLQQSYLYYSVLAELRRESGDLPGAADAYRRALELAEHPVERAFLAHRLQTCPT